MFLEADWSLILSLATLLVTLSFSTSRLIRKCREQKREQKLRLRTTGCTDDEHPEQRLIKGNAASHTSPQSSGSRLFKDRAESHLIVEAAFGLPRNVSLAAGTLVDLAVRDFVLSWYKDMSPDPEFLEDARLLMLDIVGGFICRVSKLDFALFLVKDVAPILRRNVKAFHEFRRLAEAKNPDLFRRHGADETVQTFQAREKALLDSGFMLHPGACDNGAHAQSAVIKVLRILLASNDANCFALVHLIREIIVRSIVFPALESLHPFCINSGLVSADGSSAQHNAAGDGRVVESIKAGRALLEQTFEENEEDFASSMVQTMENVIEEDHFKASGDVESEHESEIDYALVFVRVSKPDLSLDYSDPSDPVPYMSYSIDVRATASKTKKVVCWTEKTRYSKLKDLHERLLKRYPSMTATFPGNRGWKKYLLGLPDYDKAFVDARTRDLSEYISSLVRDPYVRESKLLRNFLNADYHVQALSVVPESRDQNSASSPPSAAEGSTFFSGSGQAQSLFDTLELTELYSLVEEIFLLDKGRFSFFRSNIISFVRIIVKTAFKGSLFKYLASLSERHVESITEIINALRKGTWPNGELAPPPIIPSEDVQNDTQRKALLFLKQALPKQVVSLIGAGHRDLVAETCHEMLQSHQLTKSVLLEVLDLLIIRLFPEDL